ncbi:MAG: DUF5615 family PIN-like protein [Alphaproteobacteria bacterium]|nr:DUF5615 family PIN-like protein [Alphaproteobacteria bacterium]
MTRLKLDENLGNAAVAVFARAGYDVATVHQQRLTGAADDRLFEACRAEGRCLITLDLDFANPLRFALAGSAGVCVLRYAPTAVRQSMLAAIDTLAAALRRHDVAGQLWIVTPDRIRAYSGSSDERE